LRIADKRIDEMMIVTFNINFCGPTDSASVLSQPISRRRYLLPKEQIPTGMALPFDFSVFCC
jgi:hypothetical protein